MKSKVCLLSPKPSPNGFSFPGSHTQPFWINQAHSWLSLRLCQKMAALKLKKKKQKKNFFFLFLFAARNLILKAPNVILKTTSKQLRVRNSQKLNMVKGLKIKFHTTEKLDL